MRIHQISSRAGLCATVLFLAACGEESFGSSTAGGWVRSGDLGIMGGAQVWKAGQPGVFFGVIDTPDQGQRLSYLAFFEHPVSTTEPWESAATSESSSDGFVATTDHSLAFGGDRFRAAARVEWDAEKRLATGSLRIDDREVDLRRGVVFLVDFRDEKRVQQIEVELPRLQLSPFGDAGYGDAVEAYAAQVVEVMAKREDVRTFFDRPK